MANRIFYITLLLAFESYSCEQLNQNNFPDGFKFGVATSSYQVEGAWNTSGKGENIWDYLTHNFPAKISDQSNGDVACDSYNKYKEDVQIIKSLGVNFYRFSLSWSRILPTGLPNYVNADGIRYYNDLIDELISNGIEPMVTIFHWDLPQPLQEIGGWPNAALVEHYLNFARIAFENFGDRVKKWITFNEPMQICKMGYGDSYLAPMYASSGLADYMCTYTLTRAHSAAYHLYNATYKPTQNGEIGYTMHVYWVEPQTDSAEDQKAAERMFEFYTGIFANPIFGDGDWPETVKDMVGTASFEQNLTSSRLPAFNANETELNKGTADFFGLNYYSAAVVSSVEQPVRFPIGWNNDAQIVYRPEGFGVAVGAQGIRKALEKISKTYGNIPIYITENGLGSVEAGLQDYDRANYYLRFLSACLDAIHEDKTNLVGYTAWSLMDNFEWNVGYMTRFGIHHVDFEDPNRPRTRRLSANTYEQIVKDRKLPESTIEEPEQLSTTKNPSDGDDGACAINTTYLSILVSMVYLLVFLSK